MKRMILTLVIIVLIPGMLMACPTLGVYYNGRLFYDPVGPFGAKGFGEPTLVPTIPAILNAIHDAVGVRITDLPATAEKILMAIKENEEAEVKQLGSR